MMARDAITALRLTLGLLVLTGIGFPAVLYAIGQLAFRHGAETSLVRDRCGRVTGSALVGQRFDSSYTFHGRPSASGFDGVASGGSNLGPTNPALAESLSVRASRFRAANGLPASTALPPDAITASASGLDPDISLATAELQVARVVAAYRQRGISRLDSTALTAFVRAHAQSSWPGVSGRRVNVLALNVALDSLMPRTACPGARQ